MAIQKLKVHRIRYCPKYKIQKYIQSQTIFPLSAILFLKLYKKGVGFLCLWTEVFWRSVCTESSWGEDHVKNIGSCLMQYGRGQGRGWATVKGYGPNTHPSVIHRLEGNLETVVNQQMFIWNCLHTFPPDCSSHCSLCNETSSVPLNQPIWLNGPELRDGMNSSSLHPLSMLSNQ